MVFYTNDRLRFLSVFINDILAALILKTIEISHMNCAPTPSLISEYNIWQRNQHVLREIYSNYADELGEQAQWKAALENALMFTVLKQSSYNPDLMKELTPESIQHGLSCTQIPSETKLATSLFQGIQKVMIEFEAEAPEESVSWDEKQFRFGSFSLRRNSYIDKAFTYVANEENEKQGAIKILAASIRYASIYAETRHIGPPQKVYDDFYRWGVRNEGFASPFNARLLGKNRAKFYSLFPDTDKCFGSGGSFFHLSQPVNEGHWSLDPPFLPETMAKVDQQIQEWRSAFPQIAILYIVPESHTPMVKPDETVTLFANQHYYEGLDGLKNVLPVNVCVHRYGILEDFDGQRIIQGYEKE